MSTTVPVTTEPKKVTEEVSNKLIEKNMPELIAVLFRPVK